MRRGIAAVGMLALAACGSGVTATGPPSGTPTGTTSTPAVAGDNVAATETYLADILAGNCGPVAAQFDTEVSLLLDAAKLCASYVQFTDEFGTYESQGAATMTRSPSLGAVVRLPLIMSMKPGEFRVTFLAGKIAGIFFLKQGVPL